MVFVIAECGVNWRNLSEADDMIREAAAAGVDACKFQAYKPEFHLPVNVGIFEERLLGTPYAEHLNRIALTEPDIRYLYWRCQQHGVEFMCTPMYPEAVDMLDPYVKRWKVRYADQGNVEIEKEILKYGTDKEVLISTDNRLLDHTDLKFKTLYCVPEYPPALKGLCGKGLLNGFDGFSCHYPNINSILGFIQSSDPIEYLEVHVRLDKYDPAWCPIDQRVSITMSELRQLCKELGK